jgi:DNA ligase-1
MFKPLLADPIDLPKARYPLLVSPKYDGFRCVINTMCQPMSRNLKPIPNGYVFAKLQELDLPPLDGELLTFSGDKVDDFNVVQSKLTTRSGRPDFKLMVFDNWENPNMPYVERNAKVRAYIVDRKPKYVEHVQQVLVYDEQQLLDYEAEQIALGWEGIMARSQDGIYKFGRSTTKEGILLKVKRFFDSEAEIMDAYEFKHNSNEATIDARGHTVRSSHQANMIGMDKLGGWTVKWKDQVEFDLGVGFNDQQRNDYWQHPVKHVGQTVKFKYQSVGPNGKPRFPVFLGFRSPADLDGDIPF